MHTPVLTEKVLEYLNPQPNTNIIDCTTGTGGHTIPILERIAPKGKILAIDWDPQQIKNVKVRAKNFLERLTLREGSFADIKEIARQEKFYPVHGILFDLGFSADQIENPQRGFSFRKEGPLDMRYSPKNPLTAEKIVNWSNKAELEGLLRTYGEEQFASEIAQAIVQARAQKHINKTSQLAHLIEKATPKWYSRRKIHAATKTFQALRIATNNELENLKQGLRGAVDILAPKGRIVVISFHSLEDRIVKEFFKQEPMLKPITKKPITPSPQEIQKNPKARSAKLRAAFKV